MSARFTKEEGSLDVDLKGVGDFFACLQIRLMLAFEGAFDIAVAVDSLTHIISDSCLFDDSWQQ
jgi:hypothetical protein